MPAGPHAKATGLHRAARPSRQPATSGRMPPFLLSIIQKKTRAVTTSRKEKIVSVSIILDMEINSLSKATSSPDSKPQLPAAGDRAHECDHRRDDSSEEGLEEQEWDVTLSENSEEDGENRWDQRIPEGGGMSGLVAESVSLGEVSRNHHVMGDIPVSTGRMRRRQGDHHPGDQRSEEDDRQHPRRDSR